jgi:DNA polymerase-3 subunit gamma/tau
LRRVGDPVHARASEENGPTQAGLSEPQPQQGAHPAEAHRGSEAEEGALRRVGDPVHARASEEKGPTQAGLSEPQPQGATPATAATLSLVDVRRLWPDIVEATKQRRRVTWIHLTQHAQVVAADETSLTLGFANAGARDSFANGGSLEIVRQAAIDVVGKDWKIEAIVDPGASPSGPPAASAPSRQPTRSTPKPATPDSSGADTPPDWAVDPKVPAGPPATPEAAAPSRPGPESPSTRPDPKVADAAAHRDDADAEGSDLAGAELLQRHLGAEVIEEIPHD